MPLQYTVPSGATATRLPLAVIPKSDERSRVEPSAERWTMNAPFSAESAPGSGLTRGRLPDPEAVPVIHTVPSRATATLFAVTCHANVLDHTTACVAGANFMTR